MERKWKTADGKATANEIEGGRQVMIRNENGVALIDMHQDTFADLNRILGNPFVESPQVDPWIEKAIAILPGILHPENKLTIDIAAALKSAAAEGAGEVVALNETDAYSRGVAAERERVKQVGTEAARVSDPEHNDKLYFGHIAFHACDRRSVNHGYFITRDELEAK